VDRSFIQKQKFAFVSGTEFFEHQLYREIGNEVVYAVVRAGGRQEKVEVGTIVTLDRIKADKDGNIELAAVLLVDGDKITSDQPTLAKITVTAEVLENLRGPKIVIQKFKNKTGYKKRQGHRQELTRVKVTGIK
jgi:large subunit ribosomal protein L21